MRALSDVAIIAVLALGVAFLPGGGNAARALTTALLIAFLAVMGVAGRELYRQNRLTIDSLSDRDRGILYAGVGLIVLMVAGADSMFATAGGTLAWIGLVAIGVLVIARVWVEANRY
jgi:hypothetical protein